MRLSPTPARVPVAQRVVDLAKGAFVQAVPVMLPGACAPVLVPGGDVEAYRAGLIAMGVFDEAACAALDAKPAPALLNANKPRVAIALSSPDELWSNKIKHFVATAREMGCEPVLIPPVADAAFANKNGVVTGHQREAVLRGLLRDAAAFVGPGGDDIDPKFYGAKDRGSETPNAKRDAFFLHMAKRVIDSPMMSLAICRSHQSFHVAKGGFMLQDLPRTQLVAPSAHRQAKYGIPNSEPFVVADRGDGQAFAHDVFTKAGSTHARVLGERPLTNSIHHQAVDQPGKGFVVTAWHTDPDTHYRVIEGSERWNSITTQWHPEYMSDLQQRELFLVVFRRAHVVHAARRATDVREFERLLDQSPFIDAEALRFANNARSKLSPHLSA